MSEVEASPAPELSKTASATGSENATSKPAAKKQPETSTAQSVVEQVKRFIPGLGTKEPAAASKPAAKRSRSSKKKGTDGIASADDPALATAGLTVAPTTSDLPESLVAPGLAGKERPAALNVNGGGESAGLTDEELAALNKRFSPSQALQKRLRANNKKLQRIATYEAQTEALNADQKKALASKPALEAIQRELADIIKGFEADEAEEEKKIAKKQQYEEKQVQHRIAQALSASKVDTQNDLTLLLQFLHLYSLFSPNQGFNPPVLPSVVANATGQQHAAVHTLFHTLANGPLFGGAAGVDSGDAASHIQALQSGSDKQIIEGVSFADIKQMIIDLTAPPAEVGHEIPEEEAYVQVPSEQGGLSGLPTTSAPPLAGADSDPSPNFMQASELGHGGLTVGTEAPVNDRGLDNISASATPGFGSGTPVQQRSEAGDAPFQSTTHEAPGWTGSQLTHGNIPTGTDGWADSSEPIKSWADDVDDVAPSNPLTDRAEVPAELAGQTQEADPIAVGGEAPAPAGEGVRGRGRGRGGRGRGEYRGRGRGGFDGPWRSRENDTSAPEGAVRATLDAAGDGFTDVQSRGGGRGRGRGEYRGGEYRGRGDGRGRGGFRGGERGSGEQRGRGGRGRGGFNPATPTTAAPAAAQ